MIIGVTMWRLKAGWLVLAGMLACWLAKGELWAYCAVCQTALLSSPEGRQMAGGFNTGILFLLGAPFLVAATVAFAVFKVHRCVYPVAGSKQPATEP